MDLWGKSRLMVTSTTRSDKATAKIAIQLAVNNICDTANMRSMQLLLGGKNFTTSAIAVILSVSHISNDSRFDSNASDSRVIARDFGGGYISFL